MEKFWKTYFGDWQRLVFMAVMLVLMTGLVLVLNLWGGKSMIMVVAFVMGYIMFDPLNYYLSEYSKTKRD